jgi:DNA-binding LacI/PurR family transcriptional regulator
VESPARTGTAVARPTLAEVARRAGVSTATASRVLNRSARVSEEALVRVQEAVRELGYVRHRAPSATARGTGAVAVVVFDDLMHYQADAFYSRVLQGAERALLPGGREMVVLTAARRAQRPSLVRYLCGGHVDGVLLVGMRGEDTLSALIHAAGVPVVSVGRPPEPGNLPYVDADNVGGAARAVTHLLLSGRRAVTTIAGPPDMAVGADRLRGFQAAVREAGAEGRAAVTYGDFTVVSGEHAMLRLLDRCPGLDAVFAASDLMAAGALRALHRLGVRVPADVAVIGFDDAAVARRTKPQLTTVRQPVEEMAARSVSALMDGVPEGRVVMETRLVLRESA